MSDITLKKLADLVGVHPSTVSRALDPERQSLVREKTRWRIQELADNLGYTPDMVARSLKRGRTGTVGVVVADLGNSFVTPLIHGITRALDTEDVMPLIAETQDDHDRFRRILVTMAGRRVDAIITTAARSVDRGMLERAARTVPLVVAARSMPGGRLHQVVHDDRSGGAAVARHLIELGHRKVAQLPGPSDIVNFVNRAAGFSEVCAEAGVEEISISESAARPARYEGQHLMNAILEQGDVPTAVFAANDLMAFGALDVLRDAGYRVPEDVSLVGYNDTPLLSRVDPPLTSVRYPSMAIGRTAAGLAVRLIEHPDLPIEHEMFGGELVVRDSTAPPRS